jgi:ribosomal-protein-alanine N-acetyltransferase
VVTIVRMGEGDIDAVVAIDAAAFHRAPPKLAEEGTIATASGLREELARPWARLWVARYDDTAVGFLVSWHVVDELHILNVATLPERRRQGIARALMAEAFAFARTNDVRQVFLEVRKSNDAAIQLYRKLGFSAMNVRKKYYSDDEDAVEMVLLFDPETKEIIARPDEVRLET